MLEFSKSSCILIPMDRAKEFQFPLSAKELGNHVNGPWAIFAGDGDSEFVLDKLKQLYAQIDVDFVRRLGDFVLTHRDLCLSILPDGEQWLSLRRDESILSLQPPPLEGIPDEVQSVFAFNKVEGLGQLMRFFGGMANWSLPPSPWFLPLESARVVKADCEYYDWGVVEAWEGSLPIYNTCGGNILVVSDSNRIGKWDHEFGWGFEEGGESPWTDLETDLAGLVDQFIEYQTLEMGSEEMQAAPFCF